MLSLYWAGNLEERQLEHVMVEAHSRVLVAVWSRRLIQSWIFSQIETISASNIPLVSTARSDCSLGVTIQSNCCSHPINISRANPSEERHLEDCAMVWLFFDPGSWYKLVAEFLARLKLQETWKFQWILFYSLSILFSNSSIKLLKLGLLFYYCNKLRAEIKSHKIKRHD